MNFKKLQEREQLRSQGGRCIDCAYPINGDGNKKIKIKRSGRTIKLQTLIACPECCCPDVAIVPDDTLVFSDAQKAQNCFSN